MLFYATLIFSFEIVARNTHGGLEPRIEQAFALAKDAYAQLGVDVDGALARLASVPISLHCWQGDDVAGFESSGSPLEGGLVATGNYLGRAAHPGRICACDFEKALAHSGKASHQLARKLW